VGTRFSWLFALCQETSDHLTYMTYTGDRTDRRS
jgi:hypothetical protein